MKSKPGYEHLKLPRLPAVEGGDWLPVMLYVMMQQTVRDAEAIRDRDSRYFSDCHVLSEDGWYEYERAFSVWIWSKRFSQLMESLNMGDPDLIERVRSQLLLTAGLMA